MLGSDTSTCSFTKVSFRSFKLSRADQIDGSLAREHVRDLYFHKSWDKFNEAAESKRPKTADELPTDTAFWWLLPDIIVSCRLPV
jgi:xylulokinase